MEVAKQFRVTPSLVHRLVSEYSKQPTKLRELKHREKQACETDAAIRGVVADLLERSMPIKKAAQVQRAVSLGHDLEVSLLS